MTNTSYSVLPAADYRYLLAVWESDEALMDSTIAFEGPRGERLQEMSGDHFVAVLGQVLGFGLAERIVRVMRVGGLSFPEALREVGVVVPGVKLG